MDRGRTQPCGSKAEEGSAGLKREELDVWTVPGCPLQQVLQAGARLQRCHLVIFPVQLGLLV